MPEYTPIDFVSVHALEVGDVLDIHQNTNFVTIESLEDIGEEVQINHRNEFGESDYDILYAYAIVPIYGYVDEEVVI